MFMVDPASVTLDVLHADSSWLLLNKPAGLLSVPGRGEFGRHNLAALVQAEFSDALVVHRLDMGTSGLMLFARGAEMQRQLSRSFEKRLVAKRYVAVVEGVVGPDGGEIDLPLIVDWPRRPRQIIDHQIGKPSLTRWQVLERHADTTRVALHPVTGRSHQLRVHLQSIGHPICGDELYGPDPQPQARMLLHADHLALPHPLSGEPVEFHCPAAF